MHDVYVWPLTGQPVCGVYWLASEPGGPPVSVSPALDYKHIVCMFHFVCLFIHHLIFFLNLTAVVCNAAMIMQKNHLSSTLFLCVSVSLSVYTVPIVCVSMYNGYVYMCICKCVHLPVEFRR